LKRCHHCERKFGLVRRSYALKQFCSSKCVDQHLKELEDKVVAARKIWLAYLATGHDTAAADAPGIGKT